MKKMLFTVVLGTGLFAMANAQVNIGVHANGLIPGGKVKADGLSFNQEARFSWKFGAVADISISDKFSFTPQLNVLSKAGDISDSYTETDDISGDEYRVDVKNATRLTYLELPLNIVFKKNRFFGGLGPVLSMAVSGKSEETLKYNFGGDPQTISYSPKVIFDGKKNEVTSEWHLKRFEFSANALAGYRFSNGLFVNASFSLGLSNIVPDNGDSWKNNYFGVGVGYFFFQKKR